MLAWPLKVALAALAIVLLASSCGGDAGDTRGSGETREKSSSTPNPEESTSQAPRRASLPLTYVSLGDSLAVGVGSSDPRTRGYAPLYRDLLERRTSRPVRLVQLGISGETTESFVNAPESQFSRARATLSDAPGAVVTLSIGANDLLRTAQETDAVREAALARYAANLDLILETLGGASDPRPRITVLALYNPAPGTFTDEWTGRLNETIRAVSRRHGVAVAAADETFRGRGAEYTHYARYGDIHPSDDGYEALARTFDEARIE